MSTLPYFSKLCANFKPNIIFLSDKIPTSNVLSSLIIDSSTKCMTTHLNTCTLNGCAENSMASSYPVPTQSFCDSNGKKLFFFFWAISND